MNEVIAGLLSKQTEIQATLAEALIALKGSQPPRQVDYADPDYQAKLKAETKQFKAPVFQNGFEADPSGLSDETIDRVSRLLPGHYIKGKVEVQVSPKGHVRFLYNNKTPDQRFALMAEFHSFTDLVNRIWTEMQFKATAA